MARIAVMRTKSQRPSAVIEKSEIGQRLRGKEIGYGSTCVFLQIRPQIEQQIAGKPVICGGPGRTLFERAANGAGGPDMGEDIGRAYLVTAELLVKNERFFRLLAQPMRAQTPMFGYFVYSHFISALDTKL